MFVSVLEKVESLQEQLDAYNAGEKPVTDTLDIPDGAVKPKRCRYTQSELHVQRVGMLIWFCSTFKNISLIWAYPWADVGKQCCSQRKNNRNDWLFKTYYVVSYRHYFFK